MMVAAGFSAALALAAAPASPYKALGTEPFWSLDLGKRTMTFTPMEGPKVIQAMPRAKKTRYGHVYWTRRIQVAIVRNEACSDGMSDFMYRDKVTVTVDKTVFRGCGGSRKLRPGGVVP